MHRFVGNQPANNNITVSHLSNVGTSGTMQNPLIGGQTNNRNSEIGMATYNQDS